MPITQPRMLALLSAAEDYQQAVHKLCRLIRAAADNKDADPQALLYELYHRANPVDLLTYPQESYTTINLERQHFSHSKQHRNNRVKLKQEQKRRMEGRPEMPRPHSYIDNQRPYWVEPTDRPDRATRTVPNLIHSEELSPEVLAEIQRDAKRINASYEAQKQGRTAADILGPEWAAQYERDTGTKVPFYRTPDTAEEEPPPRTTAEIAAESNADLADLEGDDPFAGEDPEEDPRPPRPPA